MLIIQLKLRVRNVRGDQISSRRWEKQGAQSQTALFPPTTVPQSTQQRKFPNNHRGLSSTQGLRTSNGQSTVYHRHFPLPWPKRVSCWVTCSMALAHVLSLTALDLPRCLRSLTSLPSAIILHHTPRGVWWFSSETYAYATTSRSAVFDVGGGGGIPHCAQHLELGELLQGAKSHKRTQAGRLKTPLGQLRTL